MQTLAEADDSRRCAFVSLAKAARRDSARLTSQPWRAGSVQGQASRRDINLIFSSLERVAGARMNEGAQRESSSEEVDLYGF